MYGRRLNYTPSLTQIYLDTIEPHERSRKKNKNRDFVKENVQFNTRIAIDNYAMFQKYQNI